MIFLLVQVAQYLLQHNYLMTALELLLECSEVGKEHEVAAIQEFFSDKNKFPLEELVKFTNKEGKYYSCQSTTS